MKKLLAAVLFLSVSAAAQTGKPDTTLSSYGDELAVLISNTPKVTSLVSFRGYLLNEAEMDETNTLEYSDGYDLSYEGLGFDGSVHGPSSRDAWGSARATGDLAYILDFQKKRGKRKAPEELADRLADIKRDVKALDTEKKSIEMSRKFAGEPQSSRVDGWDPEAARRKVSELEMQLSSAKNDVDYAAMSRSLDLFKASLPK